MVKKHLLSVVVFAVLLFPLNTWAEDLDKKAFPKVTATNPVNNAASVDPSLTMIMVTFSKPMMDKSWSWSYEDKDSFPQVTGQPYYTDNGVTCVLPVKLEPGRRYVIWINTEKFTNFRDKSGNPAAPYKLAFTTGRR